MKTRKLIVSKFGDPLGSVDFIEETLPTLDNNQLLIKVAAAPINPADINYIQGTYGVKPNLPASLGVEGSGTVIESKSNQFKQGDKVIFLNRQGTWSSHIICDQSSLILLPSSIDLNQAAMLKVNPMTAWLLLHNFTKLTAGSSVIQNAANSGVGQCVIQLCNLLNIKSYNIVRSEQRIEEIVKLGSKHHFIDNPDLKENLRSLEAFAAPSIAFNAVGGDSALRQMDCLEECGKHITYGAMSMRSLKVPNKFLIFKRISLHGLWVTKDLAAMEYTHCQSLYTKLAQWVCSGELTQAISKTYSLDQYSEALDHHLNQPRSGKILFTNKE